MLQLLRKYQKIIFWGVTVVVVMSFCFFGTYGTFNKQEVVDEQVGATVSGKPIYAREFRTLRSLLETSALDKEEGMPNFFNPGVIETNFLATGLGCMLARPYFSELKPELDASVRKMGSYRPYVHPHSSDLGVERLVSMFSPALMQNLALLRLQSDQATMRTFAQLSQLYMEQAQLPNSSQLRQFLQMQERQKGVKMDEALSRVDLSLFGVKTLPEWFGSKFTTLATAFIFNVAEVAKDKGYHVSQKEVREALFKNIAQGYTRISYGKEPTAQELQEYYVAKIRSLGVDEMQLLSAWQKVMLFEKFLDGSSHEIKLDSLPLQQLASFANESVDVDLYQLPKNLQFANFTDVCKFQLYLDLISGSKGLEGKDLIIPTAVLSVDQLQRSELVQTEATLEYRQLNAQEFATQFSLKETLDWQVKKESFDTLRSKFPQLKSASSEEARIAALESLGSADRKAVDQFSREQMVWQDQNRLHKALANKPLQTVSGGLALQVASLGVQESASLTDLLMKAPLGEPVVCRDKQEACYQITVASRAEKPHVLTFSEALSSGVLDRALDAQLAKSYPIVRKKSPEKFQLESGDWKRLELVREQVAEAAYPELAGNWQVSLAGILARADRSSLSLVQAKEVPAVLKELALEKTAQTVSRGEKHALIGNEAFSMQTGEKSLASHLGFYEVKGRSFKNSAEVSENVPQELLAFDVKKECMAQLLDYLHKEHKKELLLAPF